YYLPPNSDELLVRVKSVLTPEFNAGLSYKLIHHGTNSTDANGNRIDGVIYGNVDIPMNYSYYAYHSYNTKNFLNDGVYDISHIISLEWAYASSEFPIKVGFEYSFAYTFWINNGSSLAPNVTLPSPVTAHIFALKLSLF